MANRDIIILNTTQSRAETQQASDTVRIKGGGEILSIENSSASPILTVQSSGSQTTLSGKITSTGNLTGVITGSFGRVEGTTLIGSAFELTNTDLQGTLSASSQIASKITGSFRQGFEFTGTVSGSGGNSTGSFDRIVATTFVGDANNLGKSSEIPNTVSASSMIASDISGSFTSGFEFSSGNISGSSTTTGSFGRIEATTITGDGFELTNIAKTGTITSSAQLASRISGSFNKGFEFTNKISGSATSTGSFGHVVATTLVGSAANLTNTDKTNTISSSAQLATRISGSFNKGFEFDGEISASISGSASFTTLTAQTLVGDGSTLTNTIPTNTVSGSAQVADRISGSFNKGFEYTGTIEKAPPAWSFGAVLGYQTTSQVATGATPNAVIVVYGTAADTFNGTSWTEITAAPMPTSYGMGTGAYDAALFVGGNRSGSISWNGSAWSAIAAEGSTNRDNTYLASGAGTTEAALVFGGASGSAGTHGSISAETEAYDGSSWSEVNDMLIPKYRGSQTGIGTQNSTISHGGCGRIQTYDPPSPHSEFAISDPRQEGTHVEEWNGTNWSYLGDFYHPSPSFFFHSGAGVGTANDASFYGGYTHHYGGAGNNHTQYHWDGTAMSSGVGMLVAKQNNKGAGQGGVGGAHSSIGGYYAGAGGAASGFGAESIGAHEIYEAFFNSGSFGQVKALQFVGSGANITDFTKPSNIHSGSVQFTGISGSFNKGFEFVGTISGSAQSTGSFGQIVATTFAGDGSNLTNTALTGTVSGSAQLASDISGSFNKGFEYSGEIRTAKGVWSAGGNLNTAKRHTAGAGIQNAGLSTGGQINTNNSNAVNESEEYDGTSWTEGGNLITARRDHSGVGTQNAALLYGGYNTKTETEEYNGTSYATAGALSQGGYNKVGFGIQNAAFSTAGFYSNYNGIQDDSEQYDGAVWSNSISMIKPRTNGGAGSVNAGIKSYGFRALPARAQNCTELWNGTSWSETSEAVTTGESDVEYGTQNAFAVTAGAAGAPGYAHRKTTQFFDGTAYSVDGNLSVSGYGRGGARTSQDSGLVFGGMNPSFLTATEEYNAYYTTGSFGRIETPDVQIVQDSQLVVENSLQLPVFTSNTGIISSSAGQMWFNSTTEKLNFTIDVNSWSAGGALLIDRRGAANVGTTNAALSAGGFELGAAAATGSVEQYNGSTWSVAAKLIDEKAEGVGIGTQDSALIAAGIDDGAIQLVEFYNGTAWSEKANMIAAHGSGSAGAGTANAGLIIGGAPDIALSEEFNGTAWSESGDLIDARGYGASGGFQNSAWVAGGTANTVDSTEHYDGTSWSEVSDLITARTGLGGAGTQNAGLAFGGTFCNHTEEFNGTSWSEGNNLIQARTHLGQASAGNQSSALAIGGHTPSPAANTTLTCTEEYTVTHLKTVEIDGV